MKPQYTDRHIQVETGNDVFDGPRQVVRREFEHGLVVWFKKPVYADCERLERVPNRIFDQLETVFQNSNL